MKDVLFLDPRDTVVTALRTLEKGHLFVSEKDGREIICLEMIPIGHKVAIRDIREGEILYKYGKNIGIAKQDIHSGELVHIHNLGSLRGKERRS